ncbi:MAG: 5-(carboxyamino)imidazole ribonucleotide synthase [Gammaproteobacteria bacterium]|nr:5-(carboxyamino)imidazole ribonucleotide synthase [Gammaproteobacteria bacterium]
MVARLDAPRVAVLGAGQLGFLLCRAAQELGIETTVVANSENDPAASAADRVVIAPLDDPGLVGKLAPTVDIVTFDKEAIPGVALDALARAEAAGRLRVRPDVQILRLLQNKADQKAWLRRRGFPTLPFITFTGNEPDLHHRIAEFGLPCVQKAQRGGYDGKGVQIIWTPEELGHVWQVPSVIETCVTNMTEVAVIVARRTNGQIRCYPPVAMNFSPEMNVLTTLTAPAALPAAVGREAQRLARDVVEQLEGVGVFAVEMFLTADHRLLINEISPRVHNAGHHTLEANRTSQFEQHLRAICDMPLGPVGPAHTAVTRNLLYSPELDALCGHGPGPLPQAERGVQVWWYGKREMRLGRKVGHMTALAADSGAARRKFDRALAQLVGDKRTAA